MWEESGSINPRAVLGAQASLAVRYGSQFLQAQDKMGFAYLVYNIVKRYAEGQKFDPTTIALQNYTVDATQIFRNMLSCTGIGPVRSETLANNCGHDMERLYNLSQREISRLPKFGKVTAKKVHDAIRGVEIESD